MRCPLCQEEMKIQMYEGVEINICPHCEGVWLDKGELVKVVDTEEIEFSPFQIKDTLNKIAKEKEGRKELMGYIMSFKKNVPLEKLKAEEILNAFKEKWGETKEINCPRCGEKMEEFDYADTGVMIDRCSPHGFWLDKGELDKVQIIMEYYKRKFAPLQFPKDMIITEKKCPHCGEKLAEKRYEDVPVDICFKCGGVWLDRDELYQIVKSREEKFTQEQKAEIEPEKIIHPQADELVDETDCPICGTRMKRLAYVYSSGIIIDRCPHGHGVWLDKGELEKVQVYVEKSEELREKNYAKYTRILNQARLDSEKYIEAVIQGTKVSRSEVINKIMRWFIRKWDY